MRGSHAVPVVGSNGLFRGSEGGGGGEPSGDEENYGDERPDDHSGPRTTALFPLLHADVRVGPFWESQSDEFVGLFWDHRYVLGE